MSQLRSLSLDAVRYRGQVIPLSQLALLARLPSLRSLALRGLPLSAELPLAEGSLSLLCSLPLEHLDLRGCRLKIDYHATMHRPDLAPSPVAAVSLTLHRLQLPRVDTLGGVAEVRAVLMAYGVDRIGHSSADLRSEAAQLTFVRLDDNTDALVMRPHSCSRCCGGSRRSPR
jgi:hypothetical protein